MNNPLETLERSFRSALDQSKYNLNKALDDAWSDHEEWTTAILSGEIRECGNPLCHREAVLSGYCDECLELQQEWKQGYR